jgi:F-type H+-transporting ATPase subunit epsilon
MHLKLLRPTEVVIDQPVLKVTAEGTSGSFCLLPQHVDVVTTLVPGLFAFESETHETVFLAVDEGVLVKQGAAVWVSVRQAVRGDQLDTLQQAVQQQFHQLDEREQRARRMLARLETSLVREFIDLGG